MGPCPKGCSYLRATAAAPKDLILLQYHHTALQRPRPAILASVRLHTVIAIQRHTRKRKNGEAQDCLQTNEVTKHNAQHRVLPPSQRAGLVSRGGAPRALLGAVSGGAVRGARRQKQQSQESTRAVGCLALAIGDTPPSCAAGRGRHVGSLQLGVEVLREGLARIAAYQIAHHAGAADLGEQAPVSTWLIATFTRVASIRLGARDLLEAVVDAAWDAQASLLRYAATPIDDLAVLGSDLAQRAFAGTEARRDRADLPPPRRPFTLSPSGGPSERHAGHAAGDRLRVGHQPPHGIERMRRHEALRDAGWRRHAILDGARP